MFYVEKDKAIDVAWVYNIETDKGVSLNDNLFFANCYFPGKDDVVPEQEHMCDVYSKKANEQRCTYLDSTNFGDKSAYETKIKITKENIPFTVHIHGL